MTKYDKIYQYLIHGPCSIHGIALKKDALARGGWTWLCPRYDECRCSFDRAKGRLRYSRRRDVDR